PYKWIKDVYKNELATSWSVDWRQTDAGVKTDNKYYDERWFKSEVGVRMTMLGAPGTIAYAGEGPLYRTDLSSRADRLEGNMMKKRPAGAESRLPMVVARRKAKSVIFAALHEPYELAYAGKKLPAPKLAKSYELLAKTTTAIAVKVVGQDYVDYCMVRFKEDSKITQATPIPGILISELNKTWTFRTDPKKEGEVAKWQLPAHDASKWKKIKTDDVWEKQGYAKYNGIGWYRSTFTAAKTYKGKKLYLYFAGVDEDPKVWINGKLVGERHGIKFWNVPWHVEITDAIKLGEKNDIIVQVLDRSHAGGIYKAVSLVHSIEAIKKGTGNKQGDILTLVSNDGKLTFSFKDFGYIRIQGDKQIIKGSVKFTGLGKK
ncbi:MAG: beta galactosidase jelly roll domain-containing protein, partial [Lentisphaeria bacterium]|nr:beta galactosidase jelly roll domain-containing protein [Lentisphaeria bacterium]